MNVNYLEQSTYEPQPVELWTNSWTAHKINLTKIQKKGALAVNRSIKLLMNSVSCKAAEYVVSPFLETSSSPYSQHAMAEHTANLNLSARN